MPLNIVCSFLAPTPFRPAHGPHASAVNFGRPGNLLAAARPPSGTAAQLSWPQTATDIIRAALDPRVISHRPPPRAKQTLDFHCSRSLSPSLYLYLAVYPLLLSKISCYLRLQSAGTAGALFRNATSFALVLGPAYKLLNLSNSIRTSQTAVGRRLSAVGCRLATAISWAWPLHSTTGGCCLSTRSSQLIGSASLSAILEANNEIRAAFQRPHTLITTAHHHQHQPGPGRVALKVFNSFIGAPFASASWILARGAQVAPSCELAPRIRVGILKFAHTPSR